MSLNSFQDSFITKSFSYVNENDNENDIYLLRESPYDTPSVKFNLNNLIMNISLLNMRIKIKKIKIIK
jgi:hypothetical protein